MSTKASSSRFGNLRREIAALAARMMAEDGVRDFGFAKRKAARQLGAFSADMLPNNAEIEEELRSWLALYQDEEVGDRVQAMREAAVEVMRLFADFRPYLTGAALEGTAGRYSEVEIELYPDSAKDVEIFLLNRDLEVEHREPRRNLPGAPESILLFDWDDIPIRVAVFDPNAERSARRAQGGSARSAERARLPAVEALLAAAMLDEAASDSNPSRAPSDVLG